MKAGPKSGVKHLASLFEKGSDAVRNATGVELQLDTSADARLAEHDARRRSQVGESDDSTALRRRSSYILNDRRSVTPAYIEQSQLLAAAKARADQVRADYELAKLLQHSINA